MAGLTVGAGMLEVVVSLVLLHSPDGYVVQINPDQVTSLIAERKDRDRDGLYHEKARCLVRLADGSHVAVTETCDQVKQILEVR